MWRPLFLNQSPRRARHPLQHRAFPQDAHVPRTVVVFVDRIRLPDRKDREAFFGALEGMLRRVVGPGDMATIFAWNHSVRIAPIPT